MNRNLIYAIGKKVNDVTTIAIWNLITTVVSCLSFKKWRKRRAELRGDQSRSTVKEHVESFKYKPHRSKEVDFPNTSRRITPEVPQRKHLPMIFFQD
jgi:hypothetical protein